MKQQASAERKHMEAKSKNMDYQKSAVSSIPGSSLLRALTITSLFFVAIWIYISIYP